MLVFGIVTNLLLLGYFKYANFFVNTLDAVFGLDYHLGAIVLPLAISFFTFQQIAYLVDAYRGETREYNFVDYTLFVTFFPQLIAGPIVHHKEMLPQFTERRSYRINAVDMSRPHDVRHRTLQESRARGHRRHLRHAPVQ